MKIKNILLLILALIAAGIVLLYIFSPNILIHTISSSNGFDAAYRSITNNFYKELVITDLKLVQKNSAIGISAKKAYILPISDELSVWKTAIKFSLRDVSFISAAGSQKEKYDDLAALVAAPFKSHWIYKEISGIIIPIDGGIRVKDLEVKGDDMRVSFTGDIFQNKTLDVSVTIYFSNKLTSKIPDEMLNSMLKDENDGWKSLSVDLKGDYSSPSIQVTGKQFRLNIRSVPVTPKKDN
ncbi:MAG: hypothetical protein WC779_01895 [Candidatus Omnitrophota bacterium]|jgi:hypothetical protein